MSAYALLVQIHMINDHTSGLSSSSPKYFHSSLHIVPKVGNPFTQRRLIYGVNS